MIQVFEADKIEVNPIGVNQIEALTCIWMILECRQTRKLN